MTKQKIYNNGMIYNDNYQMHNHSQMIFNRQTSKAEDGNGGVR